MATIDRKGLSISVPALCGALLWGLVETLALLRWRRVGRDPRRVRAP